MQSSTSSRIPRRSSDAGRNPSDSEADKDRVAKVSITDQGKGAHLLRKRLALALASSTKPNVKPDLSRRKSEGKELNVREVKAGVLHRKVSQGSFPRSDDELRTSDEATEASATEKRSRKLGFVSRPNGSNIDKEEEISSAISGRLYEPAGVSSTATKNDLTGDKPNDRLSREPSSPPTRPERAPMKPGDINASKPCNLDDLEAELTALRLEASKTLDEFKGLKTATVHLKKKIQDLREDRIRLFSA